MAGSTMGRDVGRIAGNIASAVNRGRVSVVKRAALRAKDVHTAAIARVIGGDMVMSGVGRNGRKVSVGFDVKGNQNVVALIRARGPLHLVERDTPPHVIRSRYSGVRRGFIGPVGPGRSGGRRAVLNIPGIGYRRYARHPGTKGQRPWEKGKQTARPVIHTTMRKETWAVVSAAARR